MRTLTRAGRSAAAAVTALLLVPVAAIAAPAAPATAAEPIYAGHLPGPVHNIAASPGVGPGDLVIARSGVSLYWKHEDPAQTPAAGQWQAVPGDLITYNAPAIGRYNGPNGTTQWMVIAVDREGDLQRSVLTSGSWTWSAWSDLPVPEEGTGVVPTTEVAPTLLMQSPGDASGPAGGLIVAVAPTGRIFHRSFSFGVGGWRTGWSDYLGPGIVTKDPVAAAYSTITHASYLVAREDGTSKVRYRTTSSLDPGWRDVPGTFETEAAPAAVVTPAPGGSEHLKVILRASVNSSLRYQVRDVLTPDSSAWAPQVRDLPGARPGQVSGGRFAPVATANAGEVAVYQIGRDYTIGKLRVRHTAADPLLLEPSAGFTQWEQMPDSINVLPVAAYNSPEWTAGLPEHTHLNPDPWTTQPGAYGRVATAHWLGTGKDLYVARTADGRVVVTFGHNQIGDVDATWPRYGWAEIPGNMRTPYAPSVVEFRRALYVGIVDDGGRLWTTRLTTDWIGRYAWGFTPTLTWIGDLSPQRFAAGPTLITWNGNLHVVAPGVDNGIYLAQYEVSVGGWKRLTGQDTNRQVHATVAGDTLVLVTRGFLNYLYYREWGPFSDSGWKPLPHSSPGYVIAHAPVGMITTLSGTDLHLHIVYPGTNGQLYQHGAHATITEKNGQKLYGPMAWNTTPVSVLPGQTQLWTYDGVSMSDGGTGITVTAVGGTHRDVHSGRYSSVGAGTPGEEKLSVHGAMQLVPLSDKQPVPVDAGGQPIPAPPPDGTPFDPQIQPPVAWFAFCLSGNAVPDGYLPIMATDQAAATSLANQFATESYGASGWQLTAVGNPVAGGCAEPPTQQTWHFCAQDTLFPHAWIIPDFTASGTTFDQAYQAAHGYVTGLHGPQYYPSGNAAWLLGWFHTDGSGCHSNY